MTDNDHVCDSCTKIPCCSTCRQIGVAVIADKYCCGCGNIVIYKKPSEVGWTQDAS